MVFNIKYKYLDFESMEKKLTKYSKIGDLFDYPSTFACITIYFDGNLFYEKKEEGIIENVAFKNKFTITDWLWDWCYSLATQTPNIEKEPVIINSSDNPLKIIFTKEEISKVSISFEGLYNGKITVEYFTFLENAFLLLDSFIRKLQSINPKLNLDKQFQQIIEGRDKIRKMLEEASA